MLDGVTPVPADFAARYRERGYWTDQPLFEGFTGALARYAGRTAGPAVPAPGEAAGTRAASKRGGHQPGPHRSGRPGAVAALRRDHHKGNVYWELSGWAPRYFPPALRTDIRGRLREKIMFGSDHPSLPYERILREWDELGYDQSVMDLVFHANAERVLGL
jgi:hypothetical protein